MPNKPKDGDNSLTLKYKWESIPEEFREKIIQNVWCTHCSDVVEILGFQVYSAGPDIVLRERCAVCSSEVARVVEWE